MNHNILCLVPARHRDIKGLARVHSLGLDINNKRRAIIVAVMIHGGFLFLEPQERTREVVMGKKAPGHTSETTDEVGPYFPVVRKTSGTEIADQEGGDESDDDVQRGEEDVHDVTLW